MTERQWQGCADSFLMLEFLRSRGRASDRKLRLFAVACLHRLAHLITDPRGRAAVEAAERFADRLAELEELASRQAQAMVARRAAQRVGGQTAKAWAYDAAAKACSTNMVQVGMGVAWSAARAAAREVIGPFRWPESSPEWQREAATQARALHCIFGNPFRPTCCDPRWRTPEAVAVARGLYEERVSGCLPILADALLDAGCADDAILTHCRSEGPHMRGCWVVDLVLGKRGSGRTSRCSRPATR